jgi:hypothetical protein
MPGYVVHCSIQVMNCLRYSVTTQQQVLTYACSPCLSSIRCISSALNETQTINPSPD